MSINTSLYSSRSQEWETPQNLFNDLDREFKFELDVCATSRNAKCINYFTKLDDALSQNWKGVCWCNPPYGRGIDKWLKKAEDECEKHGSTIVMLIPARTDTKWFHQYIYGKVEVRFLKGRLKFSEAKNSAPFPSMICVWRGKHG